MKLRGGRNQCPTCNLYFNSNWAFDRHRMGTYGVNRRCKTVDEMLSKGMILMDGVFWGGEKMKRSFNEK